MCGTLRGRIESIRALSRVCTPRLRRQPAGGRAVNEANLRGSQFDCALSALEQITIQALYDTNDATLGLMLGAQLLVHDISSGEEPPDAAENYRIEGQQPLWGIISHISTLGMPVTAHVAPHAAVTSAARLACTAARRAHKCCLHDGFPKLSLKLLNSRKQQWIHDLKYSRIN